jgi:hypothetical protein
MPEYTVGPVRAVGMAGEGSGKPLLHAKLPVLSRLTWYEIGPDEGRAQFAHTLT